LIGWTTDTPTINGASVRHEEAERLTGGKVFPVYVEIKNYSDAVRAGAPQGWPDPWRCLGLCAERALPRPRAEGEVPTIEIQSGNSTRPLSERAA
jgi:hypothetical protein